MKGAFLRFYGGYLRELGGITAYAECEAPAKAVARLLVARLLMTALASCLGCWGAVSVHLWENRVAPRR